MLVACLVQHGHMCSSSPSCPCSLPEPEAGSGTARYNTGSTAAYCYLQLLVKVPLGVCWGACAHWQTGLLASLLHANPALNFGNYISTAIHDVWLQKATACTVNRDLATCSSQL